MLKQTLYFLGFFTFLFVVFACQAPQDTRTHIQTAPESIASSSPTTYQQMSNIPQKLMDSHQEPFRVEKNGELEVHHVKEGVLVLV